MVNQLTKKKKKNMDIFVNWEAHISGLVDDIHLTQFADTCWSFRLTRQMNATFRLAVLLGRTESLSVWHFICNMRRMGALTGSMAIQGLITAVPFLTAYGLILESDFYHRCDRISGLPLPSAPVTMIFLLLYCFPFFFSTGVILF